MDILCVLCVQFVYQLPIIIELEYDWNGNAYKCSNAEITEYLYSIWTQQETHQYRAWEGNRIKIVWHPIPTAILLLIARRAQMKKKKLRRNGNKNIFRLVSFMFIVFWKEKCTHKHNTEGIEKKITFCWRDKI